MEGGAMRILEAAHGSDLYWSAVGLRRRVLRIPLGLEFGEEELASEWVFRHLVALDMEEKVVGCLVLLLPDEAGGVARMRQVAVEPELQGLGIGRTLVRRSEELALAFEGAEMVLNAREVAQAFYEKLGYQTEGDVFLEVGLRHWKMRKRLG